MKEPIMDVDINKVRETEIELLDLFVAICERHELKYSLGYGTLLGAVRHKGFIPWDDDIDIIMPREDYERFIKLWAELKVSKYVLEESRFNDYYTNSFMKLNKANTAYLGEGVVRGMYDSGAYNGIFIDIFPMDKVPNNRILRRIQFSASCLNLLYLRRYMSDHGGWIGLTERILLNVSEDKYISRRRAANHFQQKWNSSPQKLRYVNASTFSESRLYYSSDLFDKFEKMEFCGKEYSVTSEWDSFLKSMYGDYMCLPPEKERIWTHRPVYVDFQHSYKELMEQGYFRG